MCGRRLSLGGLLSLLLLLLFSPLSLAAQPVEQMSEIEIINELLTNLEERENALEQRAQILEQREQNLIEFEAYLLRREQQISEREKSVNDRLNSLTEIENSLKNFADGLQRRELMRDLFDVVLIGVGVAGWIHR